MMENIHSLMYSLLIDNYISNEEEKQLCFTALDNLPAVQKKAKWALDWIENSTALEYYNNAWHLYHYDPKQFEHVSAEKIKIVHLNTELNVLTSEVAFQVSL